MCLDTNVAPVAVSGTWWFLHIQVQQHLLKSIALIYINMDEWGVMCWTDDGSAELARPQVPRVPAVEAAAGGGSSTRSAAKAGWCRGRQAQGHTTFHIRIAWLYLARGEVCCLVASLSGDNESVILPVRTSRRVCFSYLLCYVSWVSSLFVIVCTSKCYSPGIQFCASSYASRVLRIFVYTTLIPGMFLVPASLRFRFIVPSWIFVMRCRWKC